VEGGGNVTGAWQKLTAKFLIPSNIGADFKTLKNSEFLNWLYFVFVKNFQNFEFSS
jgi:hypothetical protein